MTDLPIHKKLDTGALSQCFKNTSTPYKFYWFLSILDFVEKGQNEIQKKELFAGLLANAWYVVNYYKISFGTQDQIISKIQEIKGVENLNIDQKKEIVFKRLATSKKRITIEGLFHFNKQVPYRFLSPWIGDASSEKRVMESSLILNKTPYQLYPNKIVLYPMWVEYFKANLQILRAFCNWHLTTYLQKKNPNTPNIGSKLFRPERKGLTKIKRDIWDPIIDQNNGFTCLYTGRTLAKDNYELDHFIPFAWVSHDLIWNLVPADSSTNNIKRDKIPELDMFIEGFYERQNQALATAKLRNLDKYLGEYISVFHSLDISINQFRNILFPIIETALLNGFNKWEQS